MTAESVAMCPSFNRIKNTVRFAAKAHVGVAAINAEWYMYSKEELCNSLASLGRLLHLETLYQGDDAAVDTDLDAQELMDHVGATDYRCQFPGNDPCRCFF